MTTKKESIRIEYKPLSTSESVSTITGNKRQTYDVNTGYFQPDRRLDPLQVLVTCNIYDAHKLVEGVVNESLTDVMWKVTDATGKLVVLQNTDKQFRIGQGADKGMITIFKNIPDLEETTIEFTARYMEPKSKRITNFQTTFSLVTVTEAVAQNQLQLTAPVGTVQFPFVNSKGLVLQADLMRAAKKVPAAYWWSKDGKEIANEAQDKLVVTSLTKAGGVYQVEVADCSMKFNELVSEKVEADKEVIEWRELYIEYGSNLIDYSLFDRQDHFEKWKQSPLGSATNKTIAKFEDYQAVKISPTTAEWEDFEMNFQVEEEKYYSINFAIKCEPGRSAKFYFLTKRKDGTVINNNILQNFEGGAGWIYFSTSFKTQKESDSVRFIIRCYKSSEVVSNNVLFAKPSVYAQDTSKGWSPSKMNIEQLIVEKTDFYASQTTLPPNYRPTPKPSVLLKKEMFLKRSLGDYDVEILYPKVVDADADSVRFEAVFTNNRGSIPDSDKYFDVGWWKKADGSFEYKGLVINVPMAKLQTLIAAGKGVEYTITEK